MATTPATRPRRPPRPTAEWLPRLAERLNRALWQLAAQRKADNRDLKIVITANAETGVGKSSLAIFLAYVLDTSATGFAVDKQATLDTGTYREAYDELGYGSALVLDEAEQLDARRAMSDENVDTAFTWQTRRVREITTILTLPTWGDLEKRMREMADVRVEILRRGAALVHVRDRDRYERYDTFWRPEHVVTWPDMSPTHAYQRLDEKKDEFLDGRDGRKMLDEEEAQERINDATEELRQEKKQLRAKALYYDPDRDMTQEEVAEQLGVSQKTVSNYVRA